MSCLGCCRSFSLQRASLGEIRTEEPLTHGVLFRALLGKTAAVKGLQISSLGQEPQATGTFSFIWEERQCLVSNWIWLELGLASGPSAG